MRGFTTFSSPKYASTWNEQTQSEFESLWSLMEPELTKLLNN